MGEGDIGSSECVGLGGVRDMQCPDTKKLVFRWFKFTLKPPSSTVHDKL